MSMANPVMTSGITIGAVVKAEKNVFPLNFLKRTRAIAAIVPTIVATVAEITPIFNEIIKALKIA